jgi:hypothetical protein
MFRARGRLTGEFEVDGLLMERKLLLQRLTGPCDPTTASHSAYFAHQRGDSFIELLHFSGGHVYFVSFAR